MFVQAVENYHQSLELRLQACDPTDRLIADSHYALATTYIYVSHGCETGNPYHTILSYTLTLIIEPPNHSLTTNKPSDDNPPPTFTSLTSVKQVTHTIPSYPIP